MVGWHRRPDGHESEQAPGAGDGQGGLACCGPWGRRVGHDWATLLTHSRHMQTRLLEHPWPSCDHGTANSWKPWERRVSEHWSWAFSHPDSLNVAVTWATRFLTLQGSLSQALSWTPICPNRMWQVEVSYRPRLSAHRAAEVWGRGPLHSSSLWN